MWLIEQFSGLSFVAVADQIMLPCSTFLSLSSCCCCFSVEDEDVIFNLVRNYVPGAVIPFLNKAEEKWASELRRISVIFLNLVRFIIVPTFCHLCIAQ
jgi:hypothetical protein